MLRSRILLPFMLLTIGLTTLPAPALRAENPLEKLHRKLFGDDGDKREEERRKEEEKDRKKWEKDRKRYEEEQRRREEEDRRNYEERNYRRDDGRVGEEERRKQADWQYRRGPSAPGYGNITRPIEADVQLGLRKSGYYGGPIDGYLGNSTRAAIREYQFDRRMPVTGKIDKRLLRSMGIE